MPELEPPLTEPTFLILLSLAPGEKHGYAILKTVAGLSHGRVTLSAGTLYGALKRLLDQGWIEPGTELDPGEGGRPRKAYRLTDLGRRHLQAELDRLKDLVGVARRYLAGAGR
jgi:DNA-binding PadR family transcriptional regulator